MGTSYHIIYRSNLLENYLYQKQVKQKITDKLLEVNRSMSTFDPDSEISRFNKINPKESFYLSDDFYRVLLIGKEIYTRSNGAWDGTVNPLIALWGFYSNKNKVPTDKEIQKTKELVGFNYLKITKNQVLKKERSGVKLDLASIAKGYAVDVISDLLRANKIRHYVVEIGGEIYAHGYSKYKTKWGIGISYPSPESGIKDVYKVISLLNKAVATSGDYRKYFKSGKGLSYSHVIDPRTGYPVRNQIASVTIIADSCVYADGLATALMVMGLNHAIVLVEEMVGVECLIIVRDQDDQLINKMSSGFKQYIRSRNEEK